VLRLQRRRKDLRDFSLVFDNQNAGRAHESTLIPSVLSYFFHTLATCWPPPFSPIRQKMKVPRFGIASQLSGG
jgi:hypothetical protein